MQRRDPDGAETSAIDALIEPKGKRLIDVGCGSGRRWLWQRPADLSGSDAR
jgi:ubiquinone/menaquinone biosynthesis C-methylase UbiE